MSTNVSALFSRPRCVLQQIVKVSGGMAVEFGVAVWGSDTGKEKASCPVRTRIG